MTTKKTTKTTASKKTAPGKAAAKAPAKKPAAPKPAAPKPAAGKSAPVVPVSAPSQPKPFTGKIAKNKHFTAKQLGVQLDRLLSLRERISGEIISISRDSLSQTEPDPSITDQGTDTFDREFALNQLSSEQDVLFEIDEAIRRLENGTYGVCEISGEPINIVRLEALPYVRYTMATQSDLEKGRKTYRPFGATIHGM